jgi:Pirin C-terminal cupin domain
LRRRRPRAHFARAALPERSFQSHQRNADEQEYGPFVMNSVDEIEQAIVDVQGGEFGPIPE